MLRSVHPLRSLGWPCECRRMWVLVCRYLGGFVHPNISYLRRFGSAAQRRHTRGAKTYDVKGEITQGWLMGNGVFLPPVPPQDADDCAGSVFQFVEKYRFIAEKGNVTTLEV